MAFSVNGRGGASSVSALAMVCDDQREMEARRHLVRTLKGGTWHMQKAGETYLPKEPKETQPAYNRRIKRTVLKNYYKKTVKSLVGRVFVKPLAVECSDDDIKTFCEDVDLQGNNLDNFAAMVMEKGMDDGITFVMGEMPKRRVDPVTGETIRPTLHDMRANGFRPYLVHVTADRVLGWRASSGPGDPTLQMVRFREDVEIEDGEFGVRTLERIRVLDMITTADGWRCRYRLFERVQAGANLLGYQPNVADPTYGYTMVDSDITSSDHIPFYPFYADRHKFMVGYPALEDLAYLNLSHWQSFSDQRNILHVARVPILFGKGFEKDEDDNYEISMEVGANIGIFGPEGSDMKYVEHTGQAIAAGKQDLDSLEEEMVTFGLEFMMSRPSHESASARILDQTEVNSPLKRVADSMLDCFENALKYMYNAIGQTDQAGEPTCKTTGELGLSLKDSAAVTNLITMRSNGDISRKSFYLELKKMSFLSDDFNVDDEIKAVEKEKAEATAQALAIAQAGPAPAPPGDNPNGNQPPAPRPPGGGAPVDPPAA